MHRKNGGDVVLSDTDCRTERLQRPLKLLCREDMVFYPTETNWVTESICRERLAAMASNATDYSLIVVYFGVDGVDFPAGE